MHAGRMLTRARKRARLTQRALADAARVPQSTVARIESGSLSPRVDTLDRLLRVTGATLASEPVLGLGVDRTQMRELLRLTPEGRLRLAEADARALTRFDAETGR